MRNTLLAGAQDKLPVVVEGQRLGLPKGSAASTHILKPAIAAVDEAACGRHTDPDGG